MYRNFRRYVLLGLLLFFPFLLLYTMQGEELIGALNGEPFYQGKPSSYWGREVARSYERRTCVIPPFILSNHTHAGELLYGDESAVPVLLCLLRHRNPNVRGWSAHALARFLRCDELDKNHLTQALIELLRDDEPYVRIMAADTLGDMGADAREAIPSLDQLLSDKRGVGYHIGTVSEAAERALLQIDPKWKQDRMP
jgi:hypothetical protein